MADQEAYETVPWSSRPSKGSLQMPLINRADSYQNS